MLDTLEVGDKVTIRRDLKEGDLKSGIYINDGMLKYQGKTLVIVKKEDGGPAVHGKLYTLNTADDRSWAWTAECFTIAPVDENRQHFGTCMECDIELSMKYMKAKGLRCPKCKKRSSD